MHKKSWRIAKAGNIASLSLVDEELAPLGDKTVRVEVAAAGLNFADIFALQGLYSATPKGAFVPGLEFAGVVRNVGSQVKRFKAGDRVMGVTRFGGYTTVIDSSEERCSPLPDTWTFAQGAAFPVQTITAWYALHSLGAVQKGQNVLIHSAAGGVGLQALNICRTLGVNALGTVSMSEKKDFLARFGFKNIVVRSEHWTQAVAELLAEKPLHLVLDAIGGEVQKESYELLAPTGRLVVFGAASFMSPSARPNPLHLMKEYFIRPKFDPLKMIQENKSLMAFNLIWLWNNAELMRQLTEGVSQLNLDAPYVGRAFAFADAPLAIKHLQSGKSVGKVVLTVFGEVLLA